MQVSGKVTSKYFGLMEKSSNNSRVALITKQAGMVLDNGMCQILFFASPAPSPLKMDLDCVDTFGL